VRILHLSSEYPPARIYGLGRFVHGLARAQAAAGDDVLVLTNSSGGEQDDVFLQGVHVHRIEFPNPPRPSDGHGEVLQFNHGLVARFLDRRSTFEGVDVVCSHDWLTALAAREIASELDAPLVVTFHDEVVGKHFGRLDRESTFVSGLERLTAHDATAVIANSEFIASQVRKHYGAERVTAVHGGIDPALLEPSGGVADFKSVLAQPGETLVTFFGRLDPEKGLEELAEAALAAGQARRELRFAIAGTGRGEEPLRRRLSSLGERVKFLGYVKGGALSLLYRASDIVVIPSLYEPFGLVALEAMLAGAAVVVSDAGGLAEIVRQGQDGLVVPVGDGDGLADAICRLTDDSKLRATLVASAQERARTEFSWARVAEKTGAIYQTAIETKRPVTSSLPPPPCRPLVSVLITTNNAPVHAEAAIRSLFARTDYPILEAVVVDTSPAPDGRLRSVAEDLRRAGQKITLLEEPSPHPDPPPAARGEGVRGLEASRGEYVCLFADECEVPPGGEGWLQALVWLLETQKAECVSPTLLERDGYTAEDLSFEAPRRAERSGNACLLIRRDKIRAILESPKDAPGHWRHAVRLVHAANEAVREPTSRYFASVATRLPASIVLVAYNNLNLTRDCLDSVLANTGGAFELVLVDNGSNDGTGDYFRSLRDRLGGPTPVQVLRNSENVGYVLAANQGIRAARGSSVVLLNNDTVVKAGWLEALIAASRTPGTGVVTAKVLNMDGTIQSAGGILHRLDGGFTIPFQGEDRLAPPVTERREVENAGGPCMLLTRPLLLEIGTFDEAFSPAYFEDSDLCMRARAAGMKLIYEPGAEVYHHGKATAQVVAQEGRIDLWRKFEENKKLFSSRWAKELGRARESVRVKRKRKQRVLLCYHKNETTTAAYCEAALRAEHDVVTAGRGQDLDLGDDVTAAALVREVGGRVDLLLVVEGENYFPRELDDAPCPTAFWAIDNHIRATPNNGWHFDVACDFDHVFVAQKDYVEAFRARGIVAEWLPLACDPKVHTSWSVEKDLDVVFVGNVRPWHVRRRKLLDRLAQSFRVHEAQGAFREDMARLFSRARIVFNCSLAGDVNMRVFEALSCGSFLVTDRIANGLDGLFGEGEHLALYDDESLEAIVARYLPDEPLRASIAARGSRLVRSHHTYAHRMERILACGTRLRRSKARTS
jgi:glycogen(starch) synthase